MRTRLDGGEWTRWTPLAGEPADGPDPGDGGRAPRGVSSPTWVGEADWVQYRSSRRLPGLRLRFMNVRGTATAADRARTAVRRVANAGVVSLASAARTAAAQRRRTPTRDRLASGLGRRRSARPAWRPR